MKRKLDCLMKEHDPITIKRHSVARSTLLLLILGLMTLNGVPSMAAGFASSLSAGGFVFSADCPGAGATGCGFGRKATGACRPASHINADASGGLNTAHVTGFGRLKQFPLVSFRYLKRQPDGVHLQRPGAYAIQQSDSRIRASEAALAYAQQVVGWRSRKHILVFCRRRPISAVAQQQMDLPAKHRASRPGQA